MMPRLDAEEAMAAAERGAIAAGNRDRTYRREVVARWARQAEIQSRTRRKQRKTPEELAALGIQVVVEEPKALRDEPD
jgi:hypothetical protein